MTGPDRPHARAMDLPGYPCPPTVRGLTQHAGTWGWVYAGRIAQDDNGHLWVESSAHPRPAPGAGMHLFAVLSWTENGIAMWLHPRGYRDLGRIPTPSGDHDWLPIATITPELPTYAQEQR